MAIIERNRTIRPSTRLESSKSYKIDTKAVESGDTLKVTINHESKPFHQTFQFKGTDLVRKDSISFRVHDYGTHIEIKWSGATPINQSVFKPLPKTIHSPVKEMKDFSKKSFEPLLTKNARILVLGTMPGELSLSKNEYYAHPRNRFWKLISALANSPMPADYSEKKNLLASLRISLWDVVHSAERNGSLDSAIKKEMPNDIPMLLNKNPEIRTIIFNGSKSAELFDKWHARDRSISFHTLPSTSPANASCSEADLVHTWGRIILNQG